jgi:hypothetical protein
MHFIFSLSDDVIYENLDISRVYHNFEALTVHEPNYLF